MGFHSRPPGQNYVIKLSVIFGKHIWSERNGKDKNVSGQDTFQHSSGWYSGCGKTCFTQSVLTDHIDELFVDIPLIVVYCYGR